MSDARSTRVRSPRTETDDVATTDRSATADGAATADRTAAAEGSETASAAETGNRETCPECGGRTRVDGAERVCADCGLVVDADRIDHGPEWRSFDDEDTDPKRTGAPLTRSRHDRGLSTEIGRSTKVKGRKRRRLARMRTQHNRAQISTKRDRNKVYAYTEIRRLTGVMGLPDSVRDAACALFDSAQEENLLRGRSLEGFAAACVYVACRTADVSRTVGEVCAEAKATEDEHQAAFDAMNRELGLPIAPSGPAEYLPRFASDLGCDPAVERRAGELAERAVEEGIANGRNPVGVAAACLYTAARELDAECTQQAAADVAGVTPVTVRRTYVDLTES
ncbi:transcription initiation factor IIB family protein [Halorubrum ezzemoulense]|uniref:Transcription initiation factor IIB n=1 Tax=Halorubrum ezzemoulense TaxID=337243 RepID=A0ABT4Z312_HALEZ|nr:transcription initiation factor IIB family protein [Halorubrum ezzemoulense]MDB2246005.1 transcription initiation factor IIB family protein [Halorubrum ezzemoulense]MDB2252792.1 transcription initiation factor IIB family protein [Halorubrum ezzemoulense]MDB2279590.1 transcription initiation factor IIB family protein [Halorubrum ezzemoulense]MDB2286075.1 transcription initiation factor IIB family protein [Halorubrum ezzemoulense]MDB2289988.1 transcription initiation factor IIB family protein